MTLIVGIVCKKAIVVASDSQTTWGTGKSYDANKMSELKYPYGRALIAESGAVVTSTETVDQLSKLAGDRKLFDQHLLSGLAEMAVRKARDKLRFQNFECSSEELQNFIERNELNSELMIAHYENGKPRIDTISLALGISQRAKSFFEAVGSGSDLATYLLGDLCQRDMEEQTASVIAVHVVEIVKRHDPYCGGPTKLGILPYGENEVSEAMKGIIGDPFRGYFRPILLSRDAIDQIVQVVADVELEMKEKRGEIIRDALRRKSEERLKEIYKILDPSL